MSTTPLETPDESKIDGEDLQELRAYLQRGETRLSTSHRVAGAFISGAGLLTLLPLLISGALSGLLISFVFYSVEGIPSAASTTRWLAFIPVLASIGLPLLALYLLIRDLILFYFTARTFSRDKRSILYPRFILSGIMVSEDSLSDAGRQLLNDVRDDEYVRDLLVPSPWKLREKILNEARGLGHLERYGSDHQEYVLDRLRKYVLQQTGSHVRTLFEEAAKMEASIARHQRYLRGLVLRYAKAFLLTILTTVITIAADSVLSLLRPVDGQSLAAVNNYYVWMTTLLLYAVWGLSASILVRQPINWLYSDSSSERPWKTPQSLLGFERVTLAVSLISSLIIVFSLWLYRESVPATAPATVIIVAIIATFLATLYVVFRGFKSEFS